MSVGAAVLMSLCYSPVKRDMNYGKEFFTGVFLI